MKRDHVLLLEIKGNTLSVDELIDNEFMCFPNPSSEFLKFNSDKIIDNLTIYNSLG